MDFADAAWWQMVADTILALHLEVDLPPTPRTVGMLAWMARDREERADVVALRAWLATQPHPAPVPVPPVAGPVPVPPAPVPPAPVPTPAADAIDLAHAVITSGSPDVRDWPISATITELIFGHNGMDINFTKRDGPQAWPFVKSGEGGEIQYTLWVGCFIDGRWYLTGAILCISRPGFANYVPTGDVFATNVDGSGLGQLPKNWSYDVGAPLATYQPSPGEMVAWFVTAGAQRRGDVHTVRARSNVVVAPFRAGRFV